MSFRNAPRQKKKKKWHNISRVKEQIFFRAALLPTIDHISQKI